MSFCWVNTWRNLTRGSRSQPCLAGGLTASLYKGSNARSLVKNTLTNRLWQFENDRLKVNELFCMNGVLIIIDISVEGGDVLFSLSPRTSGTSLHQGDSQGSSNMIIGSNSTSLFSLWVSRSPEGKRKIRIIKVNIWFKAGWDGSEPWFRIQYKNRVDTCSR